MSRALDFDIGPLTWVKGEIDQALERALASLRAFAAAPADPTPVRGAQTHFHQAHGALAIVGLDGVTRLSEEIEGFIADLQRAGDAPRPESIAAIERAMGELGAYLGALLAGTPNQPLKLYSAYRDLAIARGREVPDPVDLYYPDLTPRPPKREQPAVSVAGAEAQRYYREQRGRYQRGLLKALKKDPSGAEDMRAAIAAVEAAQSVAAQRAFWWAALGFFDALVAHALPEEQRAQRLCNRIEQQMKRLIEGSHTVAERLMRETLYQVARARPATAHLREVQEIYRLSGTVPETLEPQGQKPALQPALAVLRDTLAAAKASWNKYASNHGASLTVFQGHSAAIERQAGELGNEDARRLATAISATAAALAAHPERFGDAVAMEVATSLLLLENAAERFDALSPEFRDQAEVMAKRLAACARGDAVTGAPEVPLLDEASRRAQERQLMGQVVGEIRASLRAIEQTLDAFFREPDKRAELPALEKPLKQVQGALGMLNEPRASAALAECSERIRAFAAADYTPDRADFESIAAQLSGLGFYVDALEHGKADFDAAMQPLAPARPAPVEDADSRAAAAVSVEVELAQAKKQVATLLAAWREAPQDGNMRGQLAHTLRAVQKDAALVADARLEQEAGEALALLDDAGRGAEDAALLAALAKISGVAIPPAAPSPATNRLAESNAETIDAELLGIFLEEATEVLETIGTHLAAARAQPHALDVLRTIRRGFHTLKGSGRMVGLTRLGEGAWAVEQVMNRWLEEERTATADLFSLIDFAHRYFSVAIESLKTGGTTPEEQAVVEAAGQLRRGEPLGALVMPIVACGSPASTAAAAEAPEPASAPTVAVKTADRGQSDETESSPVPTGAAPADADAPAALDFAPLDPLSVVPLGEGPAPDEEMPSLDFSMPMRVEELQAPAHDLADDVAASARSTWSDSTAADACEPEVDDRPSLDFSIPMPSPLVAPPSAVPHAADEAGAPHESAAPVEAAPPADDVVHIGEVELSPTLFGVFVSEAQTHLAALAEEAVALARGERVSERLQRAAHTLAGIAGTVRIEPMRELGHALELATARLAGHGTGGDAAALVGECIAELDRMAAAARDLRMPDAVPELVQRLDEIGLAAPAQEEAAVFVEEVSLPAELAEATAALPAEPDVDPALAAVVDAPPLNRDAEGMAAGDAPAAPEAAPATDAARAPADRRHRRIDDDLDPELLPIFLEEAADLVPAVGQALRDWRAHSDNAAIGHALQRSLHTLKGSARMCGAMSLGELTHAMESRVENALALSVMPMSLLDELEASYDRMALLHERLLHPREAEALPPWPAFEVRAPEGSEAEVAAEASAAPAPAETASTPAPQSGPPVAPLMATRPTPARSGAPEGTASPLETGEAAARAMLRVRADVIDRLVNEAGEIAIARSRIDGEMRALKGALGDLTENVTRLRSQLREVEIQAESQMASRLTVAQERDAAFDPLEFDRFTRFQELTRMMAESVNDVQTVHQNIIKALDESDAALSAQARLNRELQQNLMRIRMVPFQSVAERLYRVVRQAAKELDKRAVLDIRGAQVELDRSVLERITAPFEHLLRNCVAHGIETPAGRAAAGKKELGEIRIELRQEGNEVMMAVSDDGAGIDVERVRAKAIALGLTEADAQLADKDIAELIFHSGFSTAAEVSQIAGRGVGMDVVKSEVQALGGRVEIAFERGKGTRFTIYLPLTLAVTQAVLVRAGGAIYAIPSALVEQVRQLKEAELQPLRETGLAVWQDRQYPFRQLPRLLGDSGYVPEKRRLTPVLYVRSGANVVALQLDEVVANQEIVVKNAGPLLSRIAGITGATVLGSGRIVLILNPVILADREPVAPPPLDTAAAAAPEPAAPTVMIVDDSLTVRKITGRLLAREGYNVVTAKDGVDAIEQLQDAVPDLMLVDIEMPRMDGFDLTRNVRNDRRLKHVPIVMITSRTAEKHRTLAREIGVDVFLGKPYQEEELLEHVATLVKRPVAA